MCTRFIDPGLRLLIAAALCSLLALPAAAHPGHGHDTPAPFAVPALDTLIDRASSSGVDQGAQMIAAPAPALVFSCCCRGQNGCCTDCDCGVTMTCASGSCGSCNAAAVLSYAVRVAPSAKGAVATLSDKSWPVMPLAPTTDRRASKRGWQPRGIPCGRAQSAHKMGQP